MMKMTQDKSGYQFIAQQIKVQINSGIYKQDDKLPSVRELAVLYSANTKTIQRAIKQLESDGFIYTVPGLGTFIRTDIEHSKSGFEQSLFNNLQKSIYALRQASVSEEHIKEQVFIFLMEDMANEHTI